MSEGKTTVIDYKREGRGIRDGYAMIQVEGRSCQSNIQARVQISQGVIMRLDLIMWTVGTEGQNKSGMGTRGHVSFEIFAQ